MTKNCEHQPRETVRGSGPCQISWDVKQRNGKPAWWCTTHGMPAGRPDGTALEACPGKFYDPVPAESRLDLDLDSGDIAMWGALAPAIAIGTIVAPRGKVHVHRRPKGRSAKDLDDSFDIVTVRHRGNEVVIEGTAASAFTLSMLTNNVTTTLVCPKPNCGASHIDELKFATLPHRKHQCNRCGRAFFDTAPSLGNPLTDLHNQLGIPPRLPAQPIRRRPLTLDTSQFAGIAIWPSNPAIITTMPRPEDIGIHVHTWDHDKVTVHDDTYSRVTVDGRPIDPNHLRVLQVQRALAPRATRRLACSSCGTDLTSPTTGWIEPTAQHVCGHCGATTRTARRLFLNPLADISRGDSDQQP